MIEVKRVDARDRIQKSGFFKNLTSWKNIYQNLTVSACFMEGDNQRRYDYKFIFTKEKLDEVTIERIEEGLKECNSLKMNFKFDDALKKIDELAESIRNKNDEFFDKLLNVQRAEILKSKEDHDKKLKRFEELEDNVNVNLKYNNLDDVVKDCEKILPLADALRKRNLSRKYADLLDKTKKKIEDKNALEEKMAQEEKETLKKQREIENQKAQEEKEARRKQRELEKQKELEEKEKLRKQKEQEEKEKRKRDRQQKKLTEQQKKADKISALEEKVKQKREEKNYNGAIKDCGKIISLANQLNDDEKAKEYAKIRDELRREALEKEQEQEAVPQKPIYTKAQITCLIAGLLMIASSIANILLLVNHVYTNIIVPFIGETPETFFIFLYGNACFTMLGGIMVVLGLIQIHSLTIKFGIPIGFMGSIMYFIVGIWAAYLCGSLLSQIITLALVFFIMGALGVIIAFYAMKKVELMEASKMTEQSSEKGKEDITVKKGIPLMTLTGMTLSLNKRLIKLGIRDVESLCRLNPETLSKKLENVSKDEIEDWIAEGKKLLE